MKRKRRRRRKFSEPKDSWTNRGTNDADTRTIKGSKMNGSLYNPFQIKQDLKTHFRLKSQTE